MSCFADRLRPVRCPKCGHPRVIALYLEPVAYRGHFEMNEDREPEFIFEQAGEIQDGGDLDLYTCAGCQRVLEVEDGRLVAKARR